MPGTSGTSSALPTEGVTAPAGCYTLFAKNNDFGTSKGPRESFRDSELNQKLGEIYGEFSSNTSDIEMRTLTASDGIMGDEVAKALWPLSEEEFNSLKNQAVFENKLAFENVNYWLRDPSREGTGTVPAMYPMSPELRDGLTLASTTIIFSPSAPPCM